MKVAAIGSREFSDYDQLKGILKPLTITMIISGGAKGADCLVQKYAKQNGVPIEIYLPDYKGHKQGAPIRRNEKIVKAADLVIAFWNGKSKGTAHVISYAQKLTKRIRIIWF